MKQLETQVYMLEGWSGLELYIWESQIFEDRVYERNKEDLEWNFEKPNLMAP